MEKFKTTRREFSQFLLGSAGMGLLKVADQPGALEGGCGITISLDGDWEITDGIEAESLPISFGHTVRVPGLAHSATPPFPLVDQYWPREYVLNMIHHGVLPPSSEIKTLGTTPQKRNYFWYRKQFHVPVKREVAILRVNKAQFGTAVWLNGKKIGEHLGCFTRGHFNVSDTIRWGSENTLLVRVGAHPGALPDWVPAGTDPEKPVWTPGIYDSVSLHLSDSPVIEAVQVAPQIRVSAVRVQTTLHNYGSATTANVVQRIKTWKEAKRVGEATMQRVALAEGEAKTITQTISIPGAMLWSPENPFLYVLETETNGDSVATRFGMREFRFDNSISRRAFLNGKPYFMRGASITLHRFFGDPLSKYHPWEENWVRKFLGEIPKRMHWNSFRICIGPAPEMWLDIADEVGLLLQYEYAIWTGSFTWRQELWKTDELLAEFREFVRDNWNHPSIAIWDASNETLFDTLREKVIPAVRGLDLSNRPWDNGYNVPQGSNDCYEDHPYLLYGVAENKAPFRLTQLETTDGRKQSAAPPSAHAAIINEYDWLWLKRDGTPTVLTKAVYEHFLGSDATPEQRFELCGYLLAGITEFWRAYRHHAAVMYLAYLDASLPNSFTCDNFRDVENLVLEPHFEDYMGQAFKPLGVYLNFWHPQLEAGTKQRFRVMCVNDDYRPAEGTLVLSIAAVSGGAATHAEKYLEIPPLGQMTYDFILEAPSPPGQYLISATASCPRQTWSPAKSRRKVSVISSVKDIHA